MPTAKPRLNVTVEPEQHALLLELARLNGGSAAGYLRQMLDQATPLLRTVVPMLRVAHEEAEISKTQAQSMIDEALQAIRDAGLNVQPDLLDAAKSGASDPARNAASASERGRAGTRGRK